MLKDFFPTQLAFTNPVEFQGIEAFMNYKCVYLLLNELDLLNVRSPLLGLVPILCPPFPFNYRVLDLPALTDREGISQQNCEHKYLYRHHPKVIYAPKNSNVKEAGAHSRKLVIKTYLF